MGENIKLNQKIFRNEFRLADKIGDDIYYNNLSGQEFKDALKKYIAEYNRADKDAWTSRKNFVVNGRDLWFNWREKIFGSDSREFEGSVPGAK